MFYVVYNPTTKQYMNDEGALGSYEDAAQFSNFLDAACSRWPSETGLRVVGPCIEGETP